MPGHLHYLTAGRSSWADIEHPRVTLEVIISDTPEKRICSRIERRLTSAEGINFRLAIAPPVFSIRDSCSARSDPYREDKSGGRSALAR